MTLLAIKMCLRQISAKSDFWADSGFTHFQGSGTHQSRSKNCWNTRYTRSALQEDTAVLGAGPRLCFFLTAHLPESHESVSLHRERKEGEKHRSVAVLVHWN